MSAEYFQFQVKSKEQVVQGIPIGKLNNHENRLKNLEANPAVLAPIAMTGTVDGVNTVFTASVAPTLLCVDGGRFMRSVSSDGTVNWTGTTTITLSVAPNFDIFGL